MIILGLTGSIGMGKSTTANMFRDADIAVFDADRTVHELYQGEAVEAVGQIFPEAVKDGQIDRQVLSKIIMEDKSAIQHLESVVHPLVHEARKAFLAKAEQTGAKLVVIDQPLIFEMGTADQMDGIIVVTAPADVQRERVLARDNMSVEKFEHILSLQVPDEEKQKYADFIIDTSLGLDAAKARVNDIIDEINTGKWQPKPR
jgi:dephospho-CoA kinase